LKPSPASTSKQLLAAAHELSRHVARLRFAAPVAHVYNPLDYAGAAHAEYLRRFGGGRKRVLFLGMNPGPFGMVQTGIPFGEVAAVRDWMGLRATITKPTKEHPARPIEGLACARSEVSGRRLWELFAGRFRTPEKFFADHFVANYCPLAFLSATGGNLTPDKLPAAEQQELFAHCDAHLRRVLETLKPEWLVGVGGFAEARGAAVASGEKIGRILHPSPASPAANRGWAAAANRQLVALGIW